jgi:hypothetical protein
VERKTTHLGDNITTLDDGSDGTLLNGGRLLETCEKGVDEEVSREERRKEERTVGVNTTEEVLLQSEGVEGRRLNVEELISTY